VKAEVCKLGIEVSGMMVNGMVVNGIVAYGMVAYGIVVNGMAAYDMAAFGMVASGMVASGVLKAGWNGAKVCCGIILRSTFYTSLSVRILLSSRPLTPKTVSNLRPCLLSRSRVPSTSSLYSLISPYR